MIQYLLVFLVVVKKTLRYSNVFFYNRTRAYAALPYFGTLLWKAVQNKKGHGI